MKLKSSEDMPSGDSAPDIQKLEGPSLTTEERVCRQLRDHIKNKKLKIRNIARALKPSISESQLRHLLNGGSPLSLERFMQIAKIVGLDPVNILQSATPDPKFGLAFTQEQEDYLVADPWRYKIMKALGTPRTEEDLARLFPEFPKIKALLQEMMDNEILTTEEIDEKIHFRVNTQVSQFASIRFSEGYTQLLQEIFREMHETSVVCQTARPDLVKFIRNMFIVDYFTPEQLLSIREKTLDLYADIRRYVGKNRSDKKYGEVAKKYLAAVMTISVPLNRASFLDHN